MIVWCWTLYWMLFSVVIVTPTREDDCVVLDTLLDVVS